MLDEIQAGAFDLLAEGAADPASAWRNLVLGTVGLDGAPQLRTVVLRAFDRARRCLEVHTDMRSAKFAELRMQPAASLLGWDSARRVQLRIAGEAALHVGDGLAASAWQALRPASRATYRVQPGPGTPCLTAADHGEMPDADAAGVFCVIQLEMRSLEYLQLAQPSHRRARFGWADGVRTAMWLVP